MSYTVIAGSFEQDGGDIVEDPQFVSQPFATLAEAVAELANHKSHMFARIEHSHPADAIRPQLVKLMQAHYKLGMIHIAKLSEKESMRLTESRVFIRSAVLELAGVDADASIDDVMQLFGITYEQVWGLSDV